MEDKLDKVYGEFMDSVFDLATELIDKDDKDLTLNEINFLNTFDKYLIEIDLDD